MHLSRTLFDLRSWLVLTCVLAVGIVELSTITRAAAAQSPPSVTGSWVGLAPDGLVYDDGTCRQDVGFELVDEPGDSLSGSVVWARTTGSTAPCTLIQSVEQTTGQVFPATIIGALDGMEISLNIFVVRTREGVPNRLTVVDVEGTTDGGELETSGTTTNRPWFDGNMDGIPQCDLGNPGSNGECGSADSRAVTLNASRASPVLSEVVNLVNEVMGDEPQAARLVPLLGQVQDSMNRGNDAAASGQLESFVRQVEALVRSGRLSPDDGQGLIDLAEELASQL